MKNKLQIVLILFLSLINISCAQETSFPKRIGYVNDYEKLFSVEEISKLENFLIEYEKQTTNEIAVLTIQEIGNESDFDTYALNLAIHWRVGKTGKDNGLVIVISNHLRKIRICTGTGTEKTLTNEICEKILNDEIIPNLKNQDTFKGIENGVKALIKKWK